MGNITFQLSTEDHERLADAARREEKTEYAIVKDAVLDRLRMLEEKHPESNQPSAHVLEMVDALRGRKWHLYQSEDYSDRNNKEWLTGRFRKASKSEILDAIALFRTKVSP